MEFFLIVGALVCVVALAFFARNTACALVFLWILSSVPAIGISWRPQDPTYVQNIALGVATVVVSIAVILDVIRGVRSSGPAEFFDPTR